MTSCEPPDVIGGVLDVPEPSLLGVELAASVVLGVADVVSVVVPCGSDDVEKNCRSLPVAAVAGAVDVPVVAGLLALGGGDDDSAVADSVASAPMSSSTTGALAN